MATTQKKTIPSREKQPNHSSSLARTMNESIKQIRKQISPPRKSASETGDPGLVPRYPLQKPLSRGLEGSGGEGRRGRRSEGRRVLHLRKASRGLQGGCKGASRGLEGGLKGASP